MGVEPNDVGPPVEGCPTPAGDVGRVTGQRPVLGPVAEAVPRCDGVPLAVLGVLPILYNTAVTLAALSKIKRMLKHSRLTALTRSDVVNRIIEVELPRYADVGYYVRGRVR